MITALDLEYHHTEKDDYTWGETYYLPVSIPEERIFGHIYVCVRPVLGCMQNDVRFIGAVSETEFEALYVDTRFHLPAPERFSHIQGPNGLSVKAVRPPRDYRIDYIGRDGTELRARYAGQVHARLRAGRPTGTRRRSRGGGLQALAPGGRGAGGSRLRLKK